MGYLNHVEAGGATAFCEPFHEEIIRYATCGFLTILTAARTHSIRGLKSQVLKLTFLTSK